MPITIRCHGCQQKIRASDKLAGKEKTCPKCGGVVHIPPPAPSFLERRARRKTRMPVSRRWTLIGGAGFVLCCLVLLGIFVVFDGKDTGESVVIASELPLPLQGPRKARLHEPAPKIEPVDEGIPPAADNDPLSAEDIFAVAAPAVATISNENDDGEVIATGSGFFIDPAAICLGYGIANLEFNQLLDREARKDDRPTRNAYLLTNYHVIESAVDADVRVNKDTRGSVVKVLTESETADLALLQVLLLTGNPSSTFSLAESIPPIGASVFAIGSPQGLQNTLSKGIVSGIRELESGNRWLQTTAPISHGSSGGPLLNVNGDVVGITTAVLTDGQNLNFAVPVSTIREMLQSPFVFRELWKGVRYERVALDRTASPRHCRSTTTARSRRRGRMR